LQRALGDAVAGHIERRWVRRFKDANRFGGAGDQPVALTDLDQTLIGHERRWSGVIPDRLLAWAGRQGEVGAGRATVAPMVTGVLEPRGRCGGWFFLNDDSTVDAQPPDREAYWEEQPNGRADACRIGSCGNELGDDCVALCC